MEVVQNATTGSDNFPNMDLGDMDIDMDMDLGPVEDEIAFHVNIAVDATLFRGQELSNIQVRLPRKRSLLRDVKAMGTSRSRTRPLHLTKSISVVLTTLPRTISEPSQRSTTLLVPRSMWSGSMTHRPISSSMTQSTLPRLLKTSPSPQTESPSLPFLRYRYVKPKGFQVTRRLFYKFVQHW